MINTGIPILLCTNLFLPINIYKNMTKRLNSVLCLEDPFTTTQPFSTKRQKFFVGKQCYQYTTTRPTSSSCSPKFRHLTTFMNLPYELRELIYTYAFSNLIEPLAHPYDDLPAHSRFQIYASLRLLNRQISYEAKKLFEKEYIEKITFYFDSGPELYDLWKEVEKLPGRLRNCGFYLRAKNFDDVDGKERPGENKLTASTEELVECQPGFRFDWRVVAPGFYRYEVNGSLRWMKRVGWEGFRVLDGGHARCGDDCVNFKEVRFPAMEKSLRLRSFVWNADFADPSKIGGEKTQQVGTLVLEGKVCDIDWSGYDVERAREQVAVHHGVKVYSDPYDYEGESEVHLDDYRFDLDGEVASESDPGVVEDVSGDSDDDASGEDDW